MTHWLLAAVALLMVVLLALLKRKLTSFDTPGEKIFAMVVMGLLPCLWGIATLADAFHGMEKREFCLSCHTMEPYGESLHAESEDSLVSNHYLNNRVDQETACYVCHTDYTQFGLIKVKLAGLRHVFHQYFGHPPEKLHLYKPYPNLNCLTCHGVAANFREAHEDDLAAIESGETSCLECHDVAHILPKAAGQEEE